MILMSWSGFSQNTFLQSLPSGYSQTVVTDGKLIFISGQISVNAKGETVGKGDVRAQTIQVFENIKLQLAQAGASFTDVIKLNYYVVNYKPEDGAMIREVRKKFLSATAPPASTLVGVSALFSPDYLIEIEAIAAVKK